MLGSILDHNSLAEEVGIYSPELSEGEGIDISKIININNTEKTGDNIAKQLGSCIFPFVFLD